MKTTNKWTSKYKKNICGEIGHHTAMPHKGISIKCIYALDVHSVQFKAYMD